MTTLALNDPAKLAIINTGINEEAGVSEILRELQQSSPGDTDESLRQVLISQLTAYGQDNQLGFYLDEFGAKEIVEIPFKEAAHRWQLDEVWDSQAEPKLHVFWLRD